MNPIEYEWQEHSLKTVMNYFKKGFDARIGEEIVDVEWFIDPVKEKAIFKLVVRKKVQERKL